MKPSAIREILAVTQRPEIISFAGGLPAPDLFPIKEIKAASDVVFDEAGSTALQYGPTDGWAPLRAQITERMARINKINTTPSNIILTAGSQQGLDFIGKMMLDKDDVVILESPSYLGAINALRPYMPRFVEIPTDEGGMIMEKLEETLKTEKNVKLIYVIPNFQNPSGRTWSLERRKEFMDIVTRYEIPVIEDNPYGDLRFKGSMIPELKSMDEKGLVMYLGTFSKILSPGMRIGWICACGEFIEKINLIAQAAILQTTTNNAMVISKYIEMYDLEAHVAKLVAEYGRRCGVMIDTMKQCFPEEAKFTIPDGGLFTWVELPEYFDTKAMAKEALEKRVAYVPGEGFFPNGGNTCCMRLNYSKEPDERTIEGINTLAGVIKANLR